MHPIIQSPRDRQLILGSGVRVQSAGYTAGGVESAYSVSFDGSNDYITVPDNDILDVTTKFSVSFWLRRNGSTGTWQTVLGKTNGGGSGLGFGFFVDNTGVDAIDFQVFSSAGDYLGRTNVALAAGWNHVVGVVDTAESGNNRVRLYLNGSVVAGTIYSLGTFSGAGVNALPLTIGTRSTISNYFRGDIDDLRIYNNKALTAAEVASIYANIASPPTDGLVAYFSFEEGTGTTTTDTVSGFVGTLTNGPTWQPQVCPRLRSGREIAENGWGVSFDGSNDYITVPHNSVFNLTSAISLVAWIKTSSAAEQYVTTKSENSFFFSVNVAAAGKLGFYLNGVSSGWLASSVNVNDGSWHLVVATYNGTTKRLYVDGVDRGSVSATGSIATGSSAFQIGIRGTSGFFNGLIKDVRIYSSALSASDIAKLANNLPIDPTLVGHWKLDDGTGTTATDSSGNGNHGTLTNGPTWTGDIPQWYRSTIDSSYAGSFDGVNDYVSVPNNAAFNDQSLFTVTMWCYLDTLGDVIPISKDGDSGFYLYFSPTHQTYIRYGSFVGTVATAPVVATWHHHTMLYNGNVSYYRNGALASTPAVATAPVGMNDTMWIGAYSSNNVGTPSGYYIDGLIDEVCIYNRALTAAEILDASLGYLVPAGLVSRWKLDGNANDSVGSNHGTEQGGVTYSSAVPGTL